MIRRTLLGAMLAATIGGVAVPAGAVIIVRERPPAARAEPVPAARRGYLWANGHWQWRNGAHRWVAGHWIRERRGYRYSQPEWIERDGRWTLNRGAWRRGDRDGDGVPNRQDRRPDDPRRY